jgi:hypothetical protein
MKCKWKLVLLQLAMTLCLLAVSQSAVNSKTASSSTQSEALVRGLYSDVVARHPLGVPSGEDLKVFTPYLSKALLHRIDINFACQHDWDRKNPDPNSKPPFLEFGFFTGVDLRAEPRSFDIEKSQLEKDGSIRVYVKFIHDDPGGNPWTWHVAVILIRENGHLVVDDVIFLKDSPKGVDVLLSEYLTQGCDGPHWVGHRNPQDDRMPQK